MSVVLELPVRFAHVDAAGIVFYPRYFEMLNAGVEEWFEAATGCSFAQMHMKRRLGVPTVSLQSEFVAPSRLGDLLSIDVSATRLGRSSCALRYCITCGAEERVRASAVLVCIELGTGKSQPWPDDLRAGLDSSAAGAEPAKRAG